jgi:predicted nucleic acid-binding protein
MPAGILNKLIISDTSCLIAFANIGHFDILLGVCRSIIITPEVAAEYKDPLPDWIQIVNVKDASKTQSIHAFLGLGESSAIALALETEHALVILDDKKARRYAHNIGLDIIGIVGLLTQAYKMGLIEDVDAILAKLQAVDFRLPVNASQLIKDI